jgi:hypothetical protein
MSVRTLFVRNPLKRYFLRNKQRQIYKWMHYFDIYHRHFRRFRGRRVTIVEFGVFHGGSLQMWKKYFGKRARIIGVDILPECKALEEEQVEIFIGNQEDREFLRRLRKEVGPIDILIEDGGHQMNQQITTFQEMFPAIRDGGVYLVEDLHTSYWPEYGGAYQKPGTFIEFAKKLIDQLNAWHTREPDALSVDDYTRTISGMHVYSSVIVFDKGKVVQPTERKTGTESYEWKPPE